MYLKTQGLVIRVTAYKDYDSLITLLTAGHGKITAKVRGLRRKNSPLTAPCQLLAYGEFLLFENRGMYTVNEAASIELFEPLRRDLTRVCLATYFVQAAEVISQEDLSNPELLSLTLNALYALSKLNLSEPFVKAVFELRLACLAGYEPNLDGCIRCGNPYPDRFHITQGHLECKDCKESGDDSIRLPVSPGILDAMRYIVRSDSKRIFSFELGSQSVESLSQITETYLLRQLEQGFSSLDFYKSIQLSR